MKFKIQYNLVMLTTLIKELHICIYIKENETSLRFHKLSQQEIRKMNWTCFFEGNELSTSFEGRGYWSNNHPLQIIVDDKFGTWETHLLNRAGLSEYGKGLVA